VCVCVLSRSYVKKKSLTPTPFCRLMLIFLPPLSPRPIHPHNFRTGTTSSKSSRFGSALNGTASLANHLNGKRLHGMAMDQITPYIVEAIKGEGGSLHCPLCIVLFVLLSAAHRFLSLF
jgi:hypothetical protein